MGRARLSLTALWWVLAFGLSAFVARYFLSPPPLLRPELPPAMAGDPIARAITGLAEHLYTTHRALLLAHIGAGIVALSGGPLQFIGRLRAARPRLHRAIGLAYVAAVVIGGVTGLPLAFLLLEGIEPSLRPSFYPSVGAFALLSPAWVACTAIAFVRARQRRLDAHRAWMIRGYSLTFAAVTARILAPLFLVLTGSPVLLANGGILLWPLNLVVAEWLARRPARAVAPAVVTA